MNIDQRVTTPCNGSLTAVMESVATAYEFLLILIISPVFKGGLLSEGPSFKAYLYCLYVALPFLFKRIKSTLPLLDLQLIGPPAASMAWFNGVLEGNVTAPGL